VVVAELLVRDFAEHRQACGLDNGDQPGALVEFHVVAVDDDRVRIDRREPSITRKRRTMFSALSCARFRCLMCFAIVSVLDVRTMTRSGFQASPIAST